MGGFSLAGRDGPGRPAVPAGELLHPVPLLALALLLGNDWLLKPGGWAPAVVTGKLSDVTGLLVAPLLVTAALDCSLWLATRLSPRLLLDFSLGRGRLWAAAAAVAGLFSAVKLSPALARALVAAAGRAGLSWRIATDPTDLLALPALAVAVWLGRRAIARVPLGRLEVLERRHHRRGLAVNDGLTDVVACGADPAEVGALATAFDRWLDGGPAEPARAALARLRGGGRPHIDPGGHTGSDVSPNRRA